MSKQFLGLGKTKYNSSICLIDDENSDYPVEMLLTERANRKKNSGAWPEITLKSIQNKLKSNELLLAENRDVHHPRVIEDTQNQLFPFYEYLEKNNLNFFTSRSNKEIEFVPHHLCHATAVLAISPFEKSVIVVMDGAGTEVSQDEFEECSVYLQDGVNLTLVFQQKVKFQKSQQHFGHSFANRIGGSYEKAAEFIFNSPHASGKVMGLASFGESLSYEDHVSFQENLSWSLSFKGKSKKEWENLDHSLFKNIAASVQKKLEEDYQKIIEMIKKDHPDYENLILTGGCALNCTNNAKILYQKLFKKIFVPPFPGDECIGFGLAHYLKFKKNPSLWKPIPFEKQSAYLGSIDSIPTEEQIRKNFESDIFDIIKYNDITEAAAHLLLDGHIIAWFQGRSESGPRALGNRSILARPDVPGLKDRLNQTIKYREGFRPYGCSVLHDKAHLYFDVEVGFDNPYMSYAIKVRPEYKNDLKEVSHVDETSRMQTVRIGQNERFYKLIETFGNKTGLYCLLNTSLNVMDEPILETVHDARRFMENTPIKYMVVDNLLIKRKS